MDLTASDFEKVLNNLETIKDTLEWQADEPTPAKVLPYINRTIKLLKSYLDEDEISTAQLELFPDVDEEEDENVYDR
jgi:hypothetical protein